MTRKLIIMLTSFLLSVSNLTVPVYGEELETEVQEETAEEVLEEQIPEEVAAQTKETAELQTGENAEITNEEESRSDETVEETPEPEETETIGEVTGTEEQINDEEDLQEGSDTVNISTETTADEPTDDLRVEENESIDGFSEFDTPSVNIDDVRESLKSLDLLETEKVLQTESSINSGVDYEYTDSIDRAEKLREFKYKPIGFSDKDGLSCSFYYNDGMMLVDSRGLSVDLALVAANLADAAYSSSVATRLTDMGYSLYHGDTYNYSKKVTYDDNDSVAFAIGYKPITYAGTDYNAYIIAIRGTSKNAEWYSDFRLGRRTDGYHEGFRVAAEDIFNAIRTIQTDNNIFLVTGHSRGAAVANIVAGELTTNPEYWNVASEEHVFGYTYACPAVSDQLSTADKSLTNIYNFNNAGDAIPELPLSKWGYDRYGKTLKLETAEGQFNNLKQRFSTELKDEYAGLLSTTSYLSTIDILAQEKADFYSPTNQLIFDVGAWFLGTKDKSELIKILLHHNVTGILKYNILKFIADGIVGELEYAFNNNQKESLELLARIDTELDMTSGYDQEAFDKWIQDNSTLVSQLKEKTEIEIKTRDDLYQARTEISASMSKLSSFYSNLETVLSLWYTSDGDPKNAVFHAHQPQTYVLWINSMFYGYLGWINNTEITSFDTVHRYLSIGDRCFYNCSNLTDLIITDDISYLGARVFVNCVNLTNVTMPVDLTYPQYTSGDNPSIFFGSTNIEKIHYTVGKTGVMPDRATGSNAANYVYYTPEFIAYNSLKEVIFDEGITRIGNNAYYKEASTSNTPALVSVTFPGTLKSIGTRAFWNQKNLVLDVLKMPEGFEAFGANSFYGCTGIKGLVLPDSTKAIGAEAFYGCTGIAGRLDLDIEGLEIGVRAFGNCKGISELIIPVDRAYPQYTSGETPSIFFGCTNIEKIHYTVGQTGVMPDRATGSNAANYVYYTPEFIAYNSLKEVIFDEGITRIGNNAYYKEASTSNTPALVSVTFPGTLKSIGTRAFWNQKNLVLDVLKMPEGFEAFGANSFYGCTGIKGLVLPDSTKAIGAEAFYGCTGIAGRLDLDIEGLEIGVRAFGNCKGISELIIPVDRAYPQYTSGETPSIFFGCTNIEKIHYTVGQTGVMRDRTTASNAANYVNYTPEFIANNSLKEVIFDEGITRIGNNAYSNNTVLVNALLPTSLTSVGTNNFTKINKSNAVFYGYKDTYGESYSNSLNVKFIPLYYPLFSDDNPGKVFRGRTVRLDGRVYTGIGIYNDNVEWSLSGQSSEETVLDENGNLYVSMDETSEEITVTIKYGEYSSELNLPVSTAKEVEVTSASIALKDKIGVNFYLYMNEDDVNDLTVNLKFNGEVISIPASEGVKKTYSGRKVRVFTVDTVARQMRDQIVLTVTDSDGYTATLTRDDQDYTDTGYPYRVVDYFAAAQEAGVTGKLGDLLEKMNNYGKYAQIQFKHNVTDEVRNTKPVDDVTLEDLDDYAARAGGEVEGIAYTSGSLELNSAISFRTYFELQEGYDISSYTFTVDGNTVTPTLKASSNSYYVSVLGIPARALGDEHTITVSDGTNTITVKYCALSYAYSVVSSDAAPDTLKNLCKAIYLYGDAAKTYFTN